MPTWPSPRSEQLGTPILPQSVSRGARISGLPVHASATACEVACPPVRIGLERPALGGFYFQAFNGSVALPVAGYDYNSDWTSVGGTFTRWNGSQPRCTRNCTCGFPAYGLYGAFAVKGTSHRFLSCCCFILLFDPRREHSSVPTAYYHRRRAQRGSRTALLQRRRRLLLDGREHGGRLLAIGGRPRNDPRGACHWPRAIAARTTLVFG